MALRNPIALLVLALIFVPLERIFSLRPSPILRRGWRTDVAHFFASHLLEQVALVAAVVTVIGLLEPLVSTSLQDRVAAQPVGLQVLEALLIIETIGYLMHRAFHAVPWLWRIHAVHHSSEHLDWLAALRVHPLDQPLTRVAQFAPLFLLGFTKELFGGLALFVGLWAIFLHANVRLRLRWLEHVIATPHFHHWHHAGDAHANFSGLFPVMDVIFGTRARLVDWPSRYGSDTAVPDRWHEQIVFPFRRATAAVDAAPDEAPR
jgi:sterol desaturase/sphingolipid hydroxylase (fatty acid hydroxylase superfamily)